MAVVCKVIIQIFNTMFIYIYISIEKKVFFLLSNAQSYELKKKKCFAEK